MTPKEATDPYAHLTAESLRGWGTAKWSFHDQDVIPAWVAEMDFPTAPAVRRALVAAVEASETNYAPSGHGVDVACADWLARHVRLRVDPARIFLVGDVLSGISAALQLLTPPGCGVIVPVPSYPPFFDTVRMTGRQVIDVRMKIDGDRWTFDLDAIDAAFAAGARAIIVCNPHNPLGRTFDRDELSALSAVVERHGARAIVDEVHAPLVYEDARFTSYVTISDVAWNHAVTITSASKGWNVAGLKCAEVIVTCEDDLVRWEPRRHDLAHGASTLGMVANRAAFDDGDEWLHETVAYLQGNRDLVRDLLASHLPCIHWFAPDATYLAWLDCRDLSVADPAAFFLQEARVALNDGASFGAGGEGHVRLNFACSRPLLLEMIDRLARATNHLRPKRPQ